MPPKFHQYMALLGVYTCVVIILLSKWGKVLGAESAGLVRERPELRHYRSACARCHTEHAPEARWPLLFDGRGQPLPIEEGTTGRVAEVWRENAWPTITGRVPAFERLGVSRFVKSWEKVK